MSKPGLRSLAGSQLLPGPRPWWGPSLPHQLPSGLRKCWLHHRLNWGDNRTSTWYIQYQETNCHSSLTFQALFRRCDSRNLNMSPLCDLDNTQEPAKWTELVRFDLFPQTLHLFLNKASAEYKSSRPNFLPSSPMRSPLPSPGLKKGEILLQVMESCICIGAFTYIVFLYLFICTNAFVPCIYVPLSPFLVF